MKNQRDIKNFDYQTVVMKKDNNKELTESYQHFGWKVINKEDHKRFANLVEVDFLRNHFIENKDQLQYLQVNMERNINLRGKLWKFKNFKSILFSSLSALLFLGLVACAVLSYFFLSAPTWIAITAVACVFAIAVAIVGIACTKIILKKEKVLYLEKDKFYEQEILDAINKAKALMGGENAQSNS